MLRSGSPRPSSKPRNTFALFATPLSRAVRPLCPIRHLARDPSSSIDVNDIANKWEKSTRDIRNTCVQLQQIYRKENQTKKCLKEVYPFPQENENEEGTKKSLKDYLPEIDEKNNTEDLNNLPIRYPKKLNDSGDFYAQYTHSNLSIMKKRPYESSENSNEGPSPKRTLITRQNLIKTKSPNTTKLPRSRAYTVPFVDRKCE